MMTAKLSVFLAAVMAIGSSFANATDFTLAPIDTNECDKVQNIVKLLSGPDVTVNAQCGDYVAPATPDNTTNDNPTFTSTLTTTLSSPYDLSPGQSVKMVDIDNNNCNFVTEQVQALSTNQISFVATCSPYVKGGYKGASGRSYDYRIYITMTVNQ